MNCPITEMSDALVTWTLRWTVHGGHLVEKIRDYYGPGRKCTVLEIKFKKERLVYALEDRINYVLVDHIHSGFNRFDRILLAINRIAYGKDLIFYCDRILYYSISGIYLKNEIQP